MSGRIAIFLIFLPCFIHAQEQGSKTEWGGYIKQLQQLYFFNNSWPAFPGPPTDEFLMDNLIHNRLNFNWKWTSDLSFTAELRTRVFYGDLVELTPGFAELIDDANNDYADLSLVLLEEESWVVHSMLDRLYVEYYTGDWEFRLGRQRVNWGIGTIWNPNDIFNAFNFADYDYEERPGSDVLRVKYYTGFASHLELVLRPADRLEEAAAAGLWKFHKGEYDLQLLGGYKSRDLVIGGGWAGNLGEAGFKGEMSYFHATIDDRDNSFTATAGIDYSFESSLYLQAGYLYNSPGASDRPASSILDYELSARNLYPYRHAVLLQSSYPFSPLINGNMTVVYSPVRSHGLLLFPTFAYSLARDWDLDLIGQIVFEKREKYTSPVQTIALRIRYSY